MTYKTEQDNIIERDAMDLFTNIPNDIFEALSVEDEELIPRIGSPVSSLMRYIESSELEADPKDIEMTLQRASHEELGNEPQNSECMRLPSLKHQTSSEILPNEPEGDHDNTEQNRRCDDCKQEDLEVCAPELNKLTELIKSSAMVTFRVANAIKLTSRVQIAYFPHAKPEHQCFPSRLTPSISWEGAR